MWCVWMWSRSLDNEEPTGAFEPRKMELKWETFQQVKQILITNPEKHDEVENGTALYESVYSVKI